MRAALVLVVTLAALLAPRGAMATTALVYATDPTTTPAPTVETLALAPSGTTLDAPALRVRSRGGASAVADPNGNFGASPRSVPAGPDPFAEVSAYFHAARAIAFFGALGVERAPIDVVVGADVAGALYVPARDPEGAALRSASGTSRDLVLLGTTDTVDLAYDGAVVAHETAHAMLDGGTRIHGWRMTGAGLVHDPEAIAEALADYFAAAITGTPVLGAFAATDPALGPARDLRLAPPPLALATAEAHRASGALSVPLWDVRSKLPVEGRRTLDEAVARVARDAWPVPPTLGELAGALVADVDASIRAPLAVALAASTLAEPPVALAPGVALVSPAGRFVVAGTRDASGALASGAFQGVIVLPVGARTLRGGLRFVTRAFAAVAVVAFDGPITWDPAGTTRAQQVPLDGDVFEVAIPPGATHAWLQIASASEDEGAYDALAVAFPEENTELAEVASAGGCSQAGTGPWSPVALLAVALLFGRRVR